MAHAPLVEYGMLQSGALHPFDDKKVGHSYSLISVIVFFLHVLSSNAMFLLDESGFTVVKRYKCGFPRCGNRMFLAHQRCQRGILR